MVNYFKMCTVEIVCRLEYQEKNEQKNHFDFNNFF